MVKVVFNMKLKYYMRGIGIGVVFTTIVFAIANMVNASSAVKAAGDTESKSTSSIIAYTTAVQATVAEEKATTIATVANETKKENQTAESTKENVTENTTQQENKTTDKQNTTKTDKTQQNITKASVGDTVEVIIPSVNYLSEISELLYEQGIISDVNGFNEYMTNTGNDTKVRKGTYTIKAGDTFENIADIITKK